MSFALYCVSTILFISWMCMFVQRKENQELRAQKETAAISPPEIENDNILEDLDLDLEKAFEKLEKQEEQKVQQKKKDEYQKALSENVAQARSKVAKKQIAISEHRLNTIGLEDKIEPFIDRNDELNKDQKQREYDRWIQLVKINGHDKIAACPGIEVTLDHFEEASRNEPKWYY